MLGSNLYSERFVSQNSQISFKNITLTLHVYVHKRMHAGRLARAPLDSWKWN